MKQKIFVRIVCLVLAVALILSVFFVVASSLYASAATIPEENTNESTFVNDSQSPAKSDFIASVGAALQADSTGTSATAGTSGYVNDDYVNLRTGAGTNYSIITCMRKNTTFTYVDSTVYGSGWCKIKLTSTSQTGYIYQDYASVSSSSSSSSETTGYVNGDYVNLRSGAGTNYSVLSCMRQNTTFTFVSTSLINTNWYNVKLSNGTKGYIYKTYATVSSVASSDSNSSSSNTSSTTTGYINDDYVNLRSGAGTSYSVVTCIRQNTACTFVSTSLYNTNWYNIKLANGSTGYVHKNYVTVNASSNTGTSNDNSANNGDLKLSASNLTLYIGTYSTLNINTTGTTSWSSSNSSVVAVDQTGLVYAKSNGTATITAKLGSSSASCTIKVVSGSGVNISNSSVNISSLKSVLLTSSTSGAKWKSSNTAVATVNGGVVDTKSTGVAVISAYTSYGEASCVLNVGESENIRFTYASPNSAPLNSTVSLKAITDNTKTAVRFVVSNGSTSYTVDATEKTADGSNYLWTGKQALSTSGKWTITAYSKNSSSNEYKTTSGSGDGEVFVTGSTNTTSTVCAERRASDDVINLIANYEGFLTCVTADSITIDPTLGYGKVVTKGEQFYNNLTKTEAYAYLCQTVNKGGYTTKTNKYLLENGIKFNQPQFDALVCFTYNVGASAIYNDSDLQSVLLNTGTGSASVSAGARGYVSGDYVNLRTGAGTNYSIITCMRKDTAFTFVDGSVYNSNWYKIKLTDGTTGYIYKSYASASSSTGTRDLANVSKQDYANQYFQYHHAAGSCYWGLLYRRVDEAEIFFYGDYKRDGEYNKKGFYFTCSHNSGFSIS